MAPCLFGWSPTSPLAVPQRYGHCSKQFSCSSLLTAAPCSGYNNQPCFTGVATRSGKVNRCRWDSNHVLPEAKALPLPYALCKLAQGSVFFWACPSTQLSLSPAHARWGLKPFAPPGGADSTYPSTGGCETWLMVGSEGRA